MLINIVQFEVSLSALRSGSTVANEVYLKRGYC